MLGPGPAPGVVFESSFKHDTGCKSNALETKDPPFEAWRPGRAYDTGICFSGSTNGMSTTTAERFPHSDSTPSEVPRSAYCVGTQA
jgi:hypothetical protein